MVQHRMTICSGFELDDYTASDSGSGITPSYFVAVS
jgi:hypothetical protein